MTVFATMKISVSTYSFSKLISRGELNQLTAIAKAKELGFDAIEMCNITPHDDSSLEAYAKKLREEADRCEFEISDLVIGADLINGKQGRTVEEEMEHVKRMVRIANILGVKYMRHDAVSSLGCEKSFDALLPTLAKRVTEIAEYAKDFGVKTMVENHGYICQDPDRCEALYNAVESDNFGLLCDMGNFLCADADPAISVSRVAPYTVFVHAKDFHVRSGIADNPGRGFLTTRAGNYIKGTVVGHGDVPVKQCLRALKRAGYGGYVSIEFEGLEDNIFALTVGLDNLRRYIAELQ